MASHGKMHTMAGTECSKAYTRLPWSGMHSGNGEHDEMDRRAIACFDQALADVGLAADPALRKVLHDYFAWATTTGMSLSPFRADDVQRLSIRRWVMGRTARGSTAPAYGAP